MSGTRYCKCEAAELYNNENTAEDQDDDYDSDDGITGE